jgi:hypothetical protein
MNEKNFQKIAVSGSRTIDDYGVVIGVFKDSPFSAKEIIHGGARGVDSLAEKFANEARIPTRIFLPDWRKFGKRAGVLRNIEIVDSCDALIAIWDGKSKGTKQAIDYAKRIGKPVYLRVFPRFGKLKNGDQK